MVSAQSPAGQRVEEGKVLEYRRFDPKQGVPEDLPALTIEDLRKITLYSELKMNGAELEVAGAKHLRRIEPLPGEPTVLVVTSDFHRFTVLRSGVIASNEISRDALDLYKFLWVKHTTRESPDGKPWLKDLLLLPFDPKSRKLAGRWPFDEKREEGRRVIFADGFFLDDGDPRPELSKVPPPEECVVGIFQSGKHSYLVLDVFANLTWWRKVAQLEYLPLRGAEQARIDDFHGDAKRKLLVKERPGAWRHPTKALVFNVVAAAPAVQAVVKNLPVILEEPAKLENGETWQDVLRLEVTGEPVEAIDSQIEWLETFGDLLAWVNDHLTKHSRPTVTRDWYDPLAKCFAENGDSYIVAMRVARYAMRRMGYPAQVVGVDDRGNHDHPRVQLHVYLPKWKVSLLLDSGGGELIVFAADSARMYELPTAEKTQRGRYPVFEIPLGGGKLMFGHVPVPR